MLQSQQIEELICLVSAMDRNDLIHQFKHYRASFPVDFTQEFLDGLDIDQMRHIFMALCLQCQRLPQMQAAAAAA